MKPYDKVAAKEAAIKRREGLVALAETVSTMTPEELKEFLPCEVITIERKTLSPRNTFLVLQQLNTATVVGGFNQWRAAGRCVRKGSKALGIWVPMTPRSAAEAPEAPEATTEPAKKYRRFIIGNVFDISQTEELT